MGSNFVIDPPAVITLPVSGDSRSFAVNRIYCVGRHYANYAREMGHDPDREPLFFFMRPASAIVADGKDIKFPNLSNDLRHEIEMVVAIGKGASKIPKRPALNTF